MEEYARDKNENIILNKYAEQFGNLPGVCYGASHSAYMDMCIKALERGTPVTEEDLEEYWASFEFDPDCIY